MSEKMSTGAPTPEKEGVEKVRMHEVEKIQVPENVKKVVEDMLDRLHNKTNDSVDVNQQCLDRFGISWKDVCKEMEERISKGFELLPETKGHKGLRVEPEFVIRSMAGKTGNWMTNKFLEVLYLSYSKSGWLKESYLKKMGENPDALKDGGENRWNLINVAPDVAPEKVEEVLKSYGLDMKKGFRMTGVEINIDEKGTTSRNIELE